MNGAESLVATLIAGGVEVCFANPGTSEMHIVAALDKAPKMRSVLALFEGVVTGAADGYARMAEKPACTLLHLGPGLGNGLANLHNASRAHVPIVNIVGQHALSHLQYDPPLASDIEGIAKPYSNWLKTSRAASEVGGDTAEAIVAARTPPGRIATLIVPADAAWSEGGAKAEVRKVPAAAMPCQAAIDRTIEILRSGERAALLIAGRALYGEGLRVAGRIADAGNARLFAPYPFARLERGAGLPLVERIHYILEQASDQLKEFRHLILVGTPAPVSYFAYPGKNPFPMPPGCEVHTLAEAGEDGVGALRAVADALPSKTRGAASRIDERPAVPEGEITLAGLAAAVGGTLPENAIVVDESMTSGRAMLPATVNAPRHDWLANTGGSIGIALPLAVGAAIACPERPVLCLSADGSGMYTLQALWTMARESLRVTTVVFANNTYGVLKREFSGLGVGSPGPRALDLFEIGRPDLDWVHLSEGMGVPACRATSLEEFTKLLRAGFESQGPSLIEIKL
ncbi:MAG TPA: acetolactate synthase large subunit [Candidatus Acidoferrum sp.]|nr:acetolactate synthase large subunit [Candidatus Acidoferrum sp.]